MSRPLTGVKNAPAQRPAGAATAAVREVTAVWADFCSSRTPELREQLLLHYLALVRQVAGRLKAGMPGSVEFDDLASAGIMGLINSIDNFDPGKGFKFETYAVPRIRGAILDSLRDEDWLPRSYRQKSRQLDRAMNNLTGRLGRLPHDHEIAAQLELGDDDYQRFMEQAGAASLLSLDIRVSSGEEGESGSLHEVIPDAETASPLEGLENKDTRQVALNLLKELSEVERRVVALYYYEELTFREIGRVLGVSESRVCQIHTKVIAALRVRLGKLME